MKPAAEGIKEFVREAVLFVLYGKVAPKDPLAELLNTVQKYLVLQARPETYIFTIKYSAKEAQQAADVANAAARLLIDFVDKLGVSEAQHGRDGLPMNCARVSNTGACSRESGGLQKSARHFPLPSGI